MKLRSLLSADKKILFSTLVQYVGKIAQLGLSVVILKLIAQALSTYDYGVYASISEYALFFSLLANLGIFAHVVRKISDAPKDGQTFFEALVLRILTASVLFVCGVVVALSFGHDIVFVGSLSLYFAALIGDYITSICLAFLQANYQMGRATLALLLGKLSYALSLYWVLQLQVENSLLLIFSLTILSAVITAGLNMYFVRRQVRWEWRVNWKNLIDILRLSIPFGAISLINGVYFRFLPDYMAYEVLTRSQFATFSIALRIAQVASLFSTFLMFSALPSLRQYLDAGAWGQVARLYRQLVWLIWVLGGAMVSIGTLAAPFLIGWLSDERYVLEEFWFLLPLMLLLAAISYGYDLVLITLFTFNQELWFLKRECVALVLAVSISLLSYAFSSDVHQIVVIIFAAIVAEIYIVLVGQKKIKQFLRKEIDSKLNN